MGGFMPILSRHPVESTWSIEDVCIGQVLMVDQPDEELDKGDEEVPSGTKMKRRSAPGESYRPERRYTTALNRYSGEGILMSVAQATTPHNLVETDGPAGLAQQCLYYMLLMREVEDRIERKLYRQGKVLGGVYVGRGQEAIPVGTRCSPIPRTCCCPPTATWRRCSSAASRPPHLRPVHGPHGRPHPRPRRQHAHGRPQAEHHLHHQRAGGHRSGRHRVRAGAALPGQAAASPSRYFGDGATSRGDWHEGVNFATVQKLPVLYICNNNQYAYSTPLNLQMACANIADKAPAYGMPPRSSTATTSSRSYEATARAARPCPCRPRPLPARVQDLPHDRPLGARWRRITCPRSCSRSGRKLDPIMRLEKQDARERLGRSGRASTTLHADVLKEVDEAVAWAEKSPYPDPATLLDGVYETS